MITASVFFIILSVAIPIIPGVRTNPYLQKTNKPITVVRKYIVRQADVLQRKEQINEWKKLSAMGKAEGSEPVPLEVGQEYEKEYTTPAKAIFWTQGLKTDKNGRVAGAGMLSLEMVLLDYIGIDMTNNPKALNETIRISIRTVAPFLILVIVSLLTKPEDRERLNGFFAKMKTPVCADKDKDAVELALSYQNPGRFNYKKMFPKSSWEFEKFSRYDIKGIVWFSLGGVLLLYLLYLVSQIGA
ncbi:MAG: hypothetical protein GWO86_02220 [Planctomycetes bacterium]|nr:hypothetical protein [Planctomycetota bacterium]